MKNRLICSNYLLSGILMFFLWLNVDFVAAQNFSISTLTGATLINPTSIQFGADGRLYVSQQDGTIKIFTIVKNGNGYNVTNTETLTIIREIPNHWDDTGEMKPYNKNTNKRQVTGILVSGTANNPVIYVNSSDNDMGAGTLGDRNLCTNSGIISKVYKENGTWKKIDLVRGLPRSEDNHATNGIQLFNNKLYIGVGGFTNSGGISIEWTYISEFAMSGCIVEVDLARIEAMPTKNDPTGNHPYKYDLPTLDDPKRTNNPDGSDKNDPWGGNDGLNQPIVRAGEPVRLFATGFRNPYDLVITKTAGRANRMFTIDNGPNRNWGGPPLLESGKATNKYDPKEPGSNTVANFDGLEMIGDMATYNPDANLYYGGHPNPIRANPTGAGLYSDDGKNRGWRNDNSNPNLPLPSNWPPMKLPAHTVESEYWPAGGDKDKSLLTFDNSTNGLCEYTADGPLKGDLFAVDYVGNIFRIKLDNNGNVLNAKGASRLNLDKPIAKGFGNSPLDITAQGDGDIFPGTLWVAVYGSNSIVALVPQDDPNCAGKDDITIDDDGDKYSNADEIDNGTNPCAASSKPDDFDKDFISDLNDPDDDNDGINDKEDFFAIDADNGVTTTMPTHYNLYNYEPGTGFFGLGFNGLMSNGKSDYLTLYTPNNLIAGGAAGAFTVEEVDEGDALGTTNTQHNAFQFGVKVAGEGVFTVKSAILPLYFNQAPKDFQSQGIFIGTGDQDNYIKIALSSNGGKGGIEVVSEIDGVATSNTYDLNQSLPTTFIEFALVVDPAGKKVFARYSVGDDNLKNAGNPITLTGKLLEAVTSNNKAIAVGVIGTSRGANTFTATWDYMEVYTGTISSIGQWNNGSISEKIYLFPNPAHDKLNIQVDTEKKVNYTVRIFNNMGQQMNTTNGNWNNDDNNDIDISGLERGVYHMQFIDESENRSSSIKFVKQ